MTTMEDILNSDFARISFDETSHSIIVVWKKPTVSESFRAIHSFILNKMKEHQVDAFICDIFYQGMITNENRLWLQDKIIPEAYACGLRKMAIVAPNDIFTRFYIESVKNSPGSVSIELEVRYFNDLISAQTWLINHNVSA